MEVDGRRSSDSARTYEDDPAVTVGFLGGGALELRASLAKSYIGHPRFPAAEANCRAAMKAIGAAPTRAGIPASGARPMNGPAGTAGSALPRSRRPTLLDEVLAEAPPGTTDALYRAFDPDDVLLYLGVTWNLRGRESAHVSSSTWFQFAVRFDIEWFGSRKEVFAAERQAIKAEQPLWNVSRNNFPAPRRRLVEYLIRKDRLDLLWAEAVEDRRSWFSSGRLWSTRPL